MNTEKTIEQRVREVRAACYVCGAVLAVGPNYPEGVAVPANVELWCPACKLINLYNIDRKQFSRAA